ncbi:MAG: M48 family metallopeptidase [Betaproteobacteria bacterium]
MVTAVGSEAGSGAGSAMPDTAQPRCPGQYFDGRSSVGRAAVAWIEKDALVLEVPDGRDAAAAPIRSHHPLATLGLGERWQRGPYPVVLPAGGTLWLQGADAAFMGALLREAGRRQPVAYLWRSWPAVLACLLMLVALLVWLDRQGVALAARAVLPLVPLKVDEAVGQRAWETVDRSWFAASSREGTDVNLRLRFDAMAQACGQGRSLRLVFRSSKSGPGFNAFALPDGTVVLLDGMAQALTEDEGLAVLAHEIGHVVHRHGMSGLVQSLGLLSVAGAVLGDFSTVAASALGTVQGLRYSREAEREADLFARRCLLRVGVDPRVMATLWSKLAAEAARQGADAIPAWLSTHPGFDERLRAAQQP